MSGIATTVGEGIGHLVLADPARRNALSVQLMHDAAQALDGFSADPAVRVVVVSGHGTDFSVGADLRQLAGDRRQAIPEAAARLFRGLEAFDRPIIAMIRGYCLGAGVAVALRADLRIATPTSVFGIPAARVGIGYPIPEVRTLVRAVGTAAAADLLLTAGRIDGVEAHRIGLVTRLAAADDLDAATLSVAEAIASNAPLSVRAAKATIAAVADPDRPEARQRAGELLDLCADSRDAREGARAIIEKRGPVFLGR
ncbi:enoyl-CoA hydratase [Pseudonocardia eucalypti]|uniref:Enoyl-CoA hydratase n=1 Tax=Pseudonocardia eucalypti TaxID=648755 RepID=A0ABP9QJR4_9PSEU|nr:enoyl-CoA hydratase/carnithine racemase [Pseudonocardia eucalypti]